MCRNRASSVCIVHLAFHLFVRPFMRLLFGIVAIAMVLTWLGVHVNSAAAQTFDDRWSIIPKANAEPAPEALDQARQDPPEQTPTGEPTRRSEDRSAPRSSTRGFSGK